MTSPERRRAGRRRPARASVTAIGPAASSTPLAYRVRQARQRAFVGRETQLREFHAALRGDTGAPSVLFLHGPGGIGKSCLLSWFADDAADADRVVVRVDCRLLAGTDLERAFEEQAAPALGCERAVLLVDTFEPCQGMETWLRERFLPRVPEGVVVVVAGRQPPGPEWTVDLGWRELVRVLPLSDLTRTEAVALLANRGVPSRLHGSLIDFAGGHPTALCLAADVAVPGSDPRTRREVVATLLDLVVDSIPALSPAHRQALQVCAHVRWTTVDVLRAVLPAEDAVESFTWLRDLPYVEAGEHGLYPHALVRDLLDEDFRWRDPPGYDAMHTTLWNHALEHAERATGGAVWHSAAALLYLHRHSGMRAELFDQPSHDELVELPYEPRLRDAVLDLAAAVEGPVAFWLDRRPEAFHVYCRRDTGEPVSFLTWLRLAAEDPDELAADPVVAAAWEHAHAAGRIRPGEHLTVARFLAPAPLPDRHTTAADLHMVRIGAEILHGGEMAASFLVLPDPHPFAAAMAFHGYHLATQVGRHGLFVHDWREVPMADHLDRAASLGGSAQRHQLPPRPAPRELDRPEFDQAVRQALRDWHHPAEVAANPLTRTRFATELEPDAPVEAVRRALAGAVEALRAEPRRVKAHRALVATYLRRNTTQEAAAERLGLPFSTYRRHLVKGVELVCDRLWAAELHGPDELS